jgi:hypothetical protein
MGKLLEMFLGSLVLFTFILPAVGNGLRQTFPLRARQALKATVKPSDIPPEQSNMLAFMTDKRPYKAGGGGSLL